MNSQNYEAFDPEDLKSRGEIFSGIVCKVNGDGNRFKYFHAL